jgi:hypothetical protein
MLLSELVCVYVNRTYTNIVRAKPRALDVVYVHGSYRFVLKA